MRTGFRIVVIGDEGVGKTSLIRKFNVKEFKRNYQPTIGVNICEVPLAGIGQAKEIEEIKYDYICFWDINITSKFRRMTDHFLHGKDGIIIVFDLTSYKTFESIASLIKESRTTISYMPILILGNKEDLKERRQVKENDVISLINHVVLLLNPNIFKYLEISVKTGENLDYVFEEVGSIIISKLYKLRRFFGSLYKV